MSHRQLKNTNVFSFGRAPQRQKQPTRRAPGPGNYTPRMSNLKQFGEVRIGTAPRGLVRVTKLEKMQKETERTISPGPGKYNPNIRFTKGGGKTPSKYSMRRRLKKKRKKFVPGPGNYKPKFSQVETVRPSFSLVGKTPPQKRRKTPGPGEYHQNRKSCVSGTPTHKIGSGNRLGFYSVQPNPGPGAYKPRPLSASIYKKDPRLVFGKKERCIIKLRKVPGPGTYRKKGFAYLNKRKQRGNAMQPRRPMSANTSFYVPGPGTYNRGFYDKKKWMRVKIGNAERDVSSSMRVPGPGTYSPKIIKFKNAGRANYNISRIGRSKRRPLSAQTYNPGPGTYKLKQIVGNERPKYSMTPSREDISIIVRRKEKLPGPDHYKPLLLQTHETHSKISIGKGNRTDFGKSYTPGPIYKHKSQLSGVRNAFGRQEQRRKDPDQKVPGPGTYYIKPKFNMVPSYVKASGWKELIL